MNTSVYRNRIDETYNSGQSILVRWKQTENFIIARDFIRTGLDIGDRSAFTERLENIFNIKFDSTNIDLDVEPLNGKYDIVTSFEVLEHLFNPLFNLLEIKNILNANGVFYLSTPLYKPRFLKSPSHFHEMSEDELLNLIERADFKVIRKKKIRVRPYCKYLVGLRPLLRLKYERVILLELGL